MIRTCLFSLLFLYFLSSCSTPLPAPAEGELFVLMRDPTGRVGEITVANANGKIRLNQNRESVKLADAQLQGKSAILSAQDIEDDFADALQVIPQSEEKYLLYFNSEKAEFTEESKKQLPNVLKNIKKRVPCRITIVGHTDTTASAEYNLALSLRRAAKVKKELLAIGIPAKMIQLAARGESEPLIPTSDNISRQENRRIEIFVK